MSKSYYTDNKQRPDFSVHFINKGYLNIISHPRKSEMYSITKTNKQTNGLLKVTTTPNTITLNESTTI